MNGGGVPHHEASLSPLAPGPATIGTVQAPLLPVAGGMGLAGGPGAAAIAGAPGGNLSGRVQAAPEVVAGWSDAQRLTEAVLRLQEQENLADDEMLAVLQEFEESSRAVTTYLALKVEHVRLNYLGSIITKRGHSHGQ